MAQPFAPAPTDTARPVRAAQSGDGNQQTATADSGAQIQATAGQRLVIPCGISARASSSLAAALADQTRRAAPRTRPAPNSAQNAGGIALIVWHKDDQLNSPIFAADARGTTVREAKQQAIAESLRGRARVDLVEAPAALALVLEDSRLDDAGLYTCTVEFDRAPTQTAQTAVVVSDPPKGMTIREETRDGLQRPLQTQLAGPYDEDSHLALVCEAEAGQPRPGQVSWWQLESVTQLSAGELRAASLAAAPGRPGAPRNSSSAWGAVESATHLTTLSLDLGESSPLLASPVDAFESADAPGRAPHRSALPPTTSGELFLGLRSFHQQNSQLSNQQLLSQLLALSNPFPSGLLQLGASGGASVVVRLRHWRRADSHRQAGAEPAQRSLSARLELGQLSRANLGNRFLCLAMNNLFSAPLNASVQLDMNLRPTEVRLANKHNVTFRLGQRTSVECHVAGSRPGATIKWHRGWQEVELESHPAGSEQRHSASAASEFSRDINNLTRISYLTLTPQISDNQQPLTCSASNPKLGVGGGADDERAPQPPGAAALSDSLLMNVQFPPRLTLKLGAGIRPDSVKLQSDVFMDCEVEANPPFQELGWLHEGRPLAENISAGVIMSNQSLVLRNIHFGQRGAYECQARNPLGGPVRSNRLLLRPRFEPICDEALTRRRYEIPINQSMRVECHVLAEPDEDLLFSWRFNRSGSAPRTGPDDADSGPELLVEKLADQPAPGLTVINQFETNFTRSSVIFTPRSKHQFGQLLCSAANSMGRQERPCVIEIVPSELPKPVGQCFVDKSTHSSFSIFCQASEFPTAESQTAENPNPGAPAGIYKHAATQYILELYAGEPPAGRTNERDSPASDSLTHSMLRQPNKHDGPPADYEQADDSGESPPAQTRIRRLVSKSPSFEVLDLQPNSTYNVLIYVQTAKGRSTPAHHQASTRPALDDYPAGSRTPTGGSNMSGGLEFLEKRARPPANQLLSFLKIDEYFSGGPGGTSNVKRPLLGVALVVLLGAISVLMAVFFVGRVCSESGSARRRKVTDAAKRKFSSGESSSSPTHDEGAAGEDEDEGFMRRKLGGNNPRTGQQRKSPRAVHGQAGGGSDSSRETNTTSTLVSSSKLAPTLAADSIQNGAPGQQLAGVYSTRAGSQVGNRPNLAQVEYRNKRCSHNDLSRLAPAGPSNCSHSHLADHPGGHFKSTTLRPRTSLMMSVRPGADDQTLVNFVRQQHLGSLYGTTCIPADSHLQTSLHELIDQTNLRQAEGACGGQSRDTPQVSSIHSSECSSNNIDNSVDSMPHHRHQPHHHLQPHLQHHLQHLGAGGPNQMHWLARNNYQLVAGQSGERLERVNLGGADGGIYVISDSHAGPAQTPLGGPIGLIDASTGDLWCPDVGQSLDERRCQLVEGAGDSPLGVPQHLLPTSFSIPVSLASRLDEAAASSATEWANQLQRLSSTENLLASRRVHEQRPSLEADCALGRQFQFAADQPAATCWPAAVACPAGMAHALSCEAAGACFPPPDAQPPAGQHLTPPSNFANDCRATGEDQAQRQAGCQRQPVARHRVKFDTSNSSAADSGLNSSPREHNA